MKFEDSNYILKESGERELFDIKKLKNSLSKSKVPENLQKLIIDEIKKHRPFKSTKQIYNFVHNFLQKHHRGSAGHYNLKNAIMQLGPSGYPFEKFIAEILYADGFDVEINMIVDGKCVSHEIDASATKNKQRFMIECKYHNSQRLKVNVKIPLYITGRFEDIQARSHTFHQSWIFTNTKFTSQAIQYSRCSNIKLTGWNYPKNESLAILIDRLKLHPITALSSLTKKQKKEFLYRGLVLCRDVLKNKQALKNMRIPENRISRIIEEAEAICQLKK